MSKKASARGKGCGTLERHGRVWRARWTVNGKTYTRSTGTSDKRQAELCLKDWTAPFRAKNERGILTGLEARVAAKDLEIQELDKKCPGYTPIQAWNFFQEKYKSEKRDPATLTNYEQWWWLFVEWLELNCPEIKELRHVTLKTAEAYARELLSGTPDEKRAVVKKARPPIRGTTYNRHLNALALIWKTVAKDPESRLGNNPFAWDKKTDTGIPRIALRKGEKPHRRRALTFQEVHALLTTAQGEWRGVIAVGYYVGIRFEDCALLQWGNVDLATRTIRTVSHKTGVETNTSIHPTLWSVLSQVVKTSTGYLFPEIAAIYSSGVTGRAKLSKTISELFRSIGIITSYKPDGSELRAVPDCSFHSLRHTYNSHMQRVGVERSVRQSLMGHKTQAMTIHYEHGYADAPLALPDLLTYGSNPTDDKLAQLKALWESLSECEKMQAMTFINPARDAEVIER